VGVASPATVDIRIIAATHRNLQSLIDDGSFREDLFYRLAVIPLELPPLRTARRYPRTGPILVSESQGEARRAELEAPAPSGPYFCEYRWPGNVRELENVIER